MLPLVPFCLAGCQSSTPTGPSYIFIDPAQREQYRLNAQNPLFERLITKWMSTTPADLAAATATFEASGDILYDQRDMAAALTSLTMAPPHSTLPMTNVARPFGRA